MFNLYYELVISTSGFAVDQRIYQLFVVWVYVFPFLQLITASVQESAASKGALGQSPVSFRTFCRYKTALNSTTPFKILRTYTEVYGTTTGSFVALALAHRNEPNRWHLMHDGWNDSLIHMFLICHA